MNNHIYISARDVAGDARLNFELDKWFGMPYRKGFALRGMTVLFLLACFSSFAQAEQCTPTPDCKTLGYTETSCPNGGGVKCPWGNFWFCGEKCNKCKLKSCEIGDVLYSDKKCYTCPDIYTLPGLPPIGIVFTTGKAVGLVDLGSMDWYEALSICRDYNINRVSGWTLLSSSEWLSIKKNRTAVTKGFDNAIGGNDFKSSTYWTSTSGRTTDAPNGNYDYYDTFDPASGKISSSLSTQRNYYVRPMLAF